MNTMFWKEVSTQVNLGVYMSDPAGGPVDFTIKVKDFAPRDVYPP